MRSPPALRAATTSRPARRRSGYPSRRRRRPWWCRSLPHRRRRRLATRRGQVRVLCGRTEMSGEKGTPARRVEPAEDLPWSHRRGDPHGRERCLLPRPDEAALGRTSRAYPATPLDIRRLLRLATSGPRRDALGDADGCDWRTLISGMGSGHRGRSFTPRGYWRTASASEAVEQGFRPEIRAISEARTGDCFREPVFSEAPAWAHSRLVRVQPR